MCSTRSCLPAPAAAIRAVSRISLYDRNRIRISKLSIRPSWAAAVTIASRADLGCFSIGNEHCGLQIADDDFQKPGRRKGGDLGIQTYRAYGCQTWSNLINHSGVVVFKALLGGLPVHILTDAVLRFPQEQLHNFNMSA